MPTAEERGLGCKILPIGAGEKSVEPHVRLGGILPSNFIVPSWRGRFDSMFNRRSDVIRANIEDQGPQDSCVGMGLAVQQTATEGVKISGHDIFRQIKAVDGDPDGWGASISDGQMVLVRSGAAEKALVNDDPYVSKAQYRSQADVTAAIIANRSRHKVRSPFYVPRTLMRETLLQHGIPVVTSTMWYKQDNEMNDGRMRMPTSVSVGGHCFACIGWVTHHGGLVELVMVNSFGADWGGADGLFHVPMNGVQNRLGNGYVALDIVPDVAELVAAYEGKDVAAIGTPDLYRIVGGRKKKYPNEVAWWLAGNAFGQDTFDISSTDLALIPDGGIMTPADVPAMLNVSNTKMAEIVRQIRQHYGQS